MTQEQIEIYSYSLAYRFLSENEKPWKGDSKKEIEYELLIKPNPSLEKIKSLMQKELKRVSKAEQFYIDSVASWMVTIKNMIEKIGDEESSKYLGIRPTIIDHIKSECSHPEFQSFNQYLIQRRDIDKCSHEELGHLSMLLTAFQRTIKIL
ncbi:hypothetical protein [uncultured Butyricimonas sp.]|uniref:hypothetical protein n=1 Tax=uncultured Butyricimonas sp. TaxID=1268785 RepID=UPI0026DC1AF6|nr:hypothetical protein [uncultured Butyricimonas sp.]